MEWVRAKDFYEASGADGWERSKATKAICKRAKAGLVRARAKLFCKQIHTGATGIERFTDTMLPVEFWWAEGDAALRQDWERGDFTTWIQGTYQWQAFGVDFCRDDIEAMGISLESNGIDIHETRPTRASGGKRAATGEELKSWAVEMVARGVTTREVDASLIKASWSGPPECRPGVESAQAAVTEVSGRGPGRPRKS